MKESSVALIDDHKLVRTGLASMIESLDGYTVTIQAGNGKEFFEKLEHIKAPDIAVVDLHMPIMDGFKTIHQLNEKHKDIKSLALTFDDSDDALVKSIRAGARGFLLKDSEKDELRVALDSLLLTGYYHTTESHQVLTNDKGLTTDAEQSRDRLLEQISERELIFLKHVCSEQEPTYEQIAAHMGVHRRTVDNYRISLFAKFNIKSKAGLVLFAISKGIVTVQ